MSARLWLPLRRIGLEEGREFKQVELIQSQICIGQLGLMLRMGMWVGSMELDKNGWGVEIYGMSFEYAPILFNWDHVFLSHSPYPLYLCLIIHEISRQCFSFIKEVLKNTLI